MPLDKRQNLLFNRLKHTMTQTTRSPAHKHHNTVGKHRTFKVDGELKNKWAYYQNKVKVLKIKEHREGSLVSVLRYVSSEKPFSNYTVWKLPFKVNHLRAFLINTELCVEEISTHHIMACLASMMTDQRKFENLMMFRIQRIVTALTIASPESADRYVSSTKVNRDKEVQEALWNMATGEYPTNDFIQDLVKLNKEHYAYYR